MWLCRSNMAQPRWVILRDYICYFSFTARTCLPPALLRNCVAGPVTSSADVQFCDVICVPFIAPASFERTKLPVMLYIDPTQVMYMLCWNGDTSAVHSEQFWFMYAE